MMKLFGRKSTDGSCVGMTQETKITRQELTADIAVTEGYESFFSCTRTVAKGRVGYSGEGLVPSVI